ncbi:hypothetical protein [Phytohabitans suffuscus]|uniref:Hemerythrin-like domain-containing protein n=1 Tax=Phytohabitans suffuscus TaxID=624315 RepID=A0A6F8YJ05_9ACTN|nr:hypothetical protein [Phytohabitans suffuscus]BCB86114.1 hypothetical protein Psuf_034270 [Phytohabitans suffuscus]
MHCLAFCGALTAHHGNEDRALPGIEARLPELSDVIVRLRAEHADIARRIEAGIDDLDQLAAELEAHFGHEETHLVPALNKAVRMGR